MAHRKTGSLTVALLALLIAKPSAAAEEQMAGRVIRPVEIVHVVADLDRSVAFYKDGLGLQLLAAPAPLTASTLVQKARAGRKAVSARSATLDIPGSALDLRLIEFAGVEGSPFFQRGFDPGVTRFSISTRDVYAAFNRVKDWPGVIVDTTSAGPVFPVRPQRNNQAVMLRDPEGFVVEFSQVDPLPGETPGVPATSNIYDARASTAVENLERSVQFWRDVLGFEAGKGPPSYSTDAILALQGLPRARGRSTSVTPPGSKNPWYIFEFTDAGAIRRAPNVEDPGASALTFEVKNVDALTARAKEMGVSIVTTGGKPVPLGNGQRGILLRNPDGLLVELVE